MSVSTTPFDSVASKSAETTARLLPLIRDRWSPRAFSDRSVPVEDLKTVLEAARWAPSSNNEQPWRFIVARKEDRETFEKILSTLVEGNQVWAKHAPVLMLAVAKKHSGEGTAENRWAAHDVGLSLAMLVIQAAELGLHVHMMAGFSPDKARQAFHIPEGFDPTTAVALGYLGSPDSLPENLRQRELAKRTRKPLREIAFGSDWNQPAFTSETD